MKEIQQYKKQRTQACFRRSCLWSVSRPWIARQLLLSSVLDSLICMRPMRPLGCWQIQTKSWNYIKWQKLYPCSKCRTTARNTYNTLYIAIQEFGIGQYPQGITTTSTWQSWRCAFWLKLCKLFLVLDLTLNPLRFSHHKLTSFLNFSESTDVNRLVVSLQTLDKK